MTNSRLNLRKAKRCNSHDLALAQETYKTSDLPLVGLASGKLYT